MKLFRPRLSAGIFAAVLAALVGFVLLFFRIGDGVTRMSYDLPQALRKNIPANDVVMVYMDEKSHTELKQPYTAPWDRSLHAELVQRLSTAGARAIVFDILFTDPSEDTQVDAEFTDAIKQSRRVALGANFVEHETMPGANGRWEEFPYAPFRAGAAAWGNVNFIQDPDYGIRHCFPIIQNLSGQDNIPWLPFAVAQFVDPSAAQSFPQDAKNVWLNYFGPPGSIPSVSYFIALQPNGPPPDFFKNKIVFIGAELTADFSGKGKDEYRTPYSYGRNGFAPGVEIHATATEDILHHLWLTRMPLSLESLLVLLVAAGAGFGLIRFQPLTATLVALTACLLVMALALETAWHSLIWFAWLIPILEIAIALLCAIIFNSLRLYVEKQLVEQSLALHLSPKLVKRLLNDPTARQVGGSQQEISILFTDIANFSRISETMRSDDLVHLMNKYFETTLQCIHETDGTVVKLIGDAIFAIWNAPLPQPDHRKRAALAALRLREQLVRFDATERTLPLRTRAGLHTGEACVGNIGSSTRFDYTAIGDSINLTSRIEGLNKQMGTQVLATREVQREVEKDFVWRQVGHFKFKGFGRAVEIFDLVGPVESAEKTRAWREKFADALQDFRQRKFDSAAEKFRSVIQMRQVVEPELAEETSFRVGDGPSHFYLEKITILRANPPSYEWIGEVELTEK
ncbi:MAG TPA: adenylate/guanylate cyclase domain-containing protein [Verrucomicrobiae bacterium]|jgi:adenylate cyclase